MLHRLKLVCLQSFQTWSSLDGLQLQPHTLRREQFWANARWTQRASWTGAHLAGSVQTITNEEVLHWYQHGIGLLFCHHGATCLYLQIWVPMSHDVRCTYRLMGRRHNLITAFSKSGNFLTNNRKKHRYADLGLPQREHCIFCPAWKSYGWPLNGKGNYRPQILVSCTAVSSIVRLYHASYKLLHDQCTT